MIPIPNRSQREANRGQVGQGSAAQTPEDDRQLAPGEEAATESRAVALGRRIRVPQHMPERLIEIVQWILEGDSNGSGGTERMNSSMGRRKARLYRPLRSGMI